MTVQNVIIGSEPKKKGRKLGSKNRFGGIVDASENEAQAFFDGEDNEGSNIDILLSGKKLIWKKKYIVQMVGLKAHGTIDTERYFGDKYVSPRLIVSEKKNKQEIFNQSAEFGMGFITLCSFMNGL